MFNPTEIIFAVTTSCNLHCPHCFVSRESFSLNARDAIQFLKTAHESEQSSIEKVGFSGGEPFLCVDFLQKVIKAAIECDFMFDRIMTNGDWWKTENNLQETLQKIYDAGYDGKIGVSYDTFHAQSEERATTFIQTAWEIFGNDSVEVQSVRGESSLKSPSVSELLQSLAQRLTLDYDETISKSGRGIATLSDGEHFLPAYIQTESFQPTDKRAWHDNKWFKDDFCESMGQILFVHANGNIAPCCGFANENESLFIGKITDSFDTVIQKARENRMIHLCFEEGLSSEIKRLQKKGLSLPGKTSDICTFCDFVCKLV